MKLFPLFLSNKVTRLLFCFFLVASLISCAHSSMRPKHKAQLKAVYIKQYKLTYLRAILKKSYNNSPAINEIITSDHSGFTEPILTDEDYKLIDSIATADNLAVLFVTLVWCASFTLIGYLE